jgi:hypothetical protein
MKGLILTVVASDAGGAERNGKCDSNLASIVVSRPLGEDEGLGTAPDFSDGGGLRLRGMGGGMMGRPSYICDNSVSVGIGVVRALVEEGDRRRQLSPRCGEFWIG